MISLRIRLMLKRLKKSLKNGYYKLVSPIGKLIDKICKSKEEKFKRDVEDMDINEVVRRLKKLIIKRLLIVSDSKFNKSIEFEIAESTDYEDSDETIIEFMRRQKHDKKLKRYAYNIDYNNYSEMNIVLSKILKYVLEKNGCKVEFVERSYYLSPKNYINTMIIRL